MNNMEINLPEGMEKINRRNIYEQMLKRWLVKYLPILTWIPNYSLENLQCDFIAGITVGLMVVPQALAYASLAGLSNQYGLFSAFMGCFVYCLLGTSKDVTIGPSAIVAMLVATYNVPHCIQTATTLSVYAGCVLLLMGIFNLGFLVRFVSVPVVSGFTSAASITIALGQLKELNGLKKNPEGFFPDLIYTLKNISAWNLYDLAFGIGCIILLLLLKLLPKLQHADETNKLLRVLRKFAWFCGIGRNALVVFFSCLVIYCFDKAKISHYFTLIEDIDNGIPPFKVPSFPRHCYSGTSCNVTTEYSFTDTVDQFKMGILIVPLLALMETMAIGKAFGRLNKYKIVPSQELIALGISNILGSFVSGFPITGSFSRTAVNSQSGVKTPLSGIFTATVVLLSTQFLTQYFNYIPKACLGAIIIIAVLSMVDFRIVKSIWKVNKMDLISYFVTFLGCFYSLEFGLIFGIIISLCILLRPVINPKITVEKKDVAIIRVQNGLQHPGIEKIINKVEEILSSPLTPPIAVIIDMNGVTEIDFTVATELHEFINQTRNQQPGIEILVTNVCFEVKRVLIMSGLHDIITSPENVSETYEGDHQTGLIG